MPRKQRIHFKGAFYHVMLQGDGGKNIFRNEADAIALQDLMIDGLERFGHRIHAWCFIVNQVHLLIQVGDRPLSKIMQNLSFRYTRHFNKATDSTGHVFHDRYKALLVEDDQNLITLLRYMHQSPVTAGLCQDLADWRWSSDKIYRTGRADGITDPRHLQKMLGDTRETATNEYAKLMADDTRIAWPPKGSRSTAIVGSDRFVKKALRKRGASKAEAPKANPEALMKACAEVSGLTLKQMQSASRERHIARARYMTAIVLRDKAGLTMTDIAARFGRDVSTLSRGVNTLERRMYADKDLAAEVTKFKRAVNKLAN